jgi:hypothetical protein
MVPLTACVMWVAVLAGEPASAPADKAAAEIKWARGVADDFWLAVLAGQTKPAAALLSPELAKSLATFETIGAGEGYRLSEWPADRWLSENLPTGPDVTVTLDAGEVSADRTEVLFRGRLTGKSRRGTVLEADVTMRVAKETATGKWAVRFLLVADRREQGGGGKR